MPINLEVAKFLFSYYLFVLLILIILLFSKTLYDLFQKCSFYLSKRKSYINTIYSESLINRPADSNKLWIY